MEQVDHRDQFYCFYIEFNDNLCNGILMLPLAFPVTYQVMKEVRGGCKKFCTVPNVCL